MASTSKLYLDGEPADLDLQKGFPLSFVYSIEQASDISRINGSHSKRSVTIPGTKRNGQLLSRAHDLRVDIAGQVAEIPCRVEDGGIPIFTGKAKLNGVPLARGSRYPEGYKLSLFGNNAEWFSRLKGRRLNSYDFGTHLYTEANIEQGTIGGLNQGVYFLAKWKNWTGADHISYRDLTFAITITDIIQKVFRDIGYVVFSEFFQSVEGERYILPVPFRGYGLEWRQQNSDLQARKNSQQGPIGPPVVVTNWDNVEWDGGGLFNQATGVYTVPFDGTYNVGGYVYATLDDGMGNQFPGQFDFLRVYVNGVEVPGNTTQLFLNQGDLVDFRYQTPGGGLVAYVDTAFAAIYYGNSFDFGVPITPSGLIPDEWLVEDLLVDLTVIMGLMWDSDVDNGQVFVEPRDKHKSRTNLGVGPSEVDHSGFLLDTLTEDVGGKIDLAKRAEIEYDDSLENQYRLSWKTDGDTEQAIEDNENMGIYDARFNFSNGRFSPGEKTIPTRFFAKTIHLRDTEIKHEDSDIVPQVPLFWPSDYAESPTEDEADYDIEPRLLWYAGRRAGKDGYVNFQGTPDPYDPPTAFFVNYNDSTGFDPSLAFSNEQSINNAVLTGLMARLHLQHLKRLELSTYLEEYLWWTRLDILGLNWRRKLIIDGVKYILQKVDGYRPNSGASTKTLLLKDAIPSALDKDSFKIQGSGLLGVVDSPATQI